MIKLGSRVFLGLVWLASIIIIVSLLLGICATLLVIVFTIPSALSVLVVFTLII